MNVSVPAKTQIHQAIDRLRPDQLARLWEYVQWLVQEPAAPLYHIHEQAIATGVADLAEQHDHYLYGRDKPIGLSPTAPCRFILAHGPPQPENR